jgi:hypothetical protein
MAQAAKIEINPTDAPTEVATATSAADTPAVAVIWRNGKDTPRGAWFPAADIEAVRLRCRGDGHARCEGQHR